MSPADKSGRHVDLASLVTGVFFLTAAVLWGLGGGDSLGDNHWRVPLLLIITGGVGVIGSLARRTRR